MLERLNEMPFCKAKHSDSFIYLNWHRDAAQICCLQLSSRLTRVPQAWGDAEPSLLSAFLGRIFFHAVGTAARVGEAGDRIAPSTPEMHRPLLQI